MAKRREFQKSYDDGSKITLEWYGNIEPIMTILGMEKEDIDREFLGRNLNEKLLLLLEKKGFIEIRNPKLRTEQFPSIDN